MKRLAVIALVVLTAACDKKGDGNSTPSASASVGAPASASASASAVVAPAGPRTFKGTYTAKAAPMYVPDGGEYAGVKFRGDDAGDALGEGNLTLTIDKDGIVSGEGSGALGAIVIAGLERDGDVTFTVSRKEANDLGPTGTGVATLSDKTIDGTLRVSAYRAQIIREATFKLSAAP